MKWDYKWTISTIVILIFLSIVVLIVVLLTAQNDDPGILTPSPEISLETYAQLKVHVNEPTVLESKLSVEEVVKEITVVQSLEQFDFSQSLGEEMIPPIEVSVEELVKEMTVVKSLDQFDFSQSLGEDMIPPIETMTNTKSLRLLSRKKLDGTEFGYHTKFGLSFERLDNKILISSGSSMVLLRQDDAYTTLGRFRNKFPCGLMFESNLHHWWIYSAGSLRLQIESGFIYPVENNVEQFSYDKKKFVILRDNILSWKRLSHVSSDKCTFEELNQVATIEESKCYHIFLDGIYTFLCHDNGNQVMYKDSMKLFEIYSLLRVKNMTWNDNSTLFAVQYENQIDIHDVKDGVRVHQEIFDTMVGTVQFLGESVLIVGLPNLGSGELVYFEVGFSCVTLCKGEPDSCLGAVSLSIDGSGCHFNILCSTNGNYIEDIDVVLEDTGPIT
jgi:hypothetical protein